ncbi:MAG: CoA transferase, partial [Chloroflexi bacterium]|nr:CoA transferase [Chloroflexota bacterium]
MAGPLDGIKVLECSTWGFGPIGGMMLGDLGADVIKIESPTRPDAARFVESVAGIPNMMPDGHSALFEAVNRNKRSLALDLKSERGQELFRKLIVDTDVFIENYRPGTFEKLGLSTEALMEINPGLVHAATAGYGFKGDESHLPALDAVGQARGGFMYSGGGPADPPNWNTLGIADVMGATCLAYGVLAAIAGRELNGGQGQRIEVSHIMATMWLQFWGIGVGLMQGLDLWPRFDRSKAANPLWNLYRCGDDKWLMLGILEAERDWASFCRAVGLEEIVDDERFTTLSAMGEHCEVLIALLEERFAS